MKFLLFGLQRSGTNYTEAVMLENFKNIEFLNEHYPKALPTHKHFRLYDEKHLVPSTHYLNQFFFPAFQDFDALCQRLTNESNIGYLVVVKNPYAWYQSYLRYANRTTEIDFWKKDVNGQFILEWNLFHKKWLDFQTSNPERVKVIRYQDMLENLAVPLGDLKSQFNLEPKHTDWYNPPSVGMSRKFSLRRKDYYISNSYVEDILPTHMRVISELLDEEVMKKLNFEKIASEPTYAYQTSYKPKT